MQVLSLGETQYFRPAVRVRLNRGVFEQISSIAGLSSHLSPLTTLVFSWNRRIGNPPSAVPEYSAVLQRGMCPGSPSHLVYTSQIYGFQIRSFRQPSEVVFYPSAPNRLNLRISNFDFV